MSSGLPMSTWACSICAGRSVCRHTGRAECFGEGNYPMPQSALRAALKEAADDAGDLAKACCEYIDVEGWASWHDDALSTSQAQLRRVLRRVLANLERFDDLTELGGSA